MLPELSRASPTVQSVAQSSVVERAVSVTNITRIDLNTGLEVPPHFNEDLPKYSDVLVSALIAGNVAIAGGVGACIAATAGLGVWPCVSLGAGAVILNYLTVWLIGTVSLVKRAGIAFDDVKIQIHSAWVPIDGSDCNTACLFVANAPINTWTALGNTTYADGTVVQMHAFHDGVEGGIRGLQAFVPSLASTKGRRQIYDDYNGVTTQYYFEQEGQTGRDDLVAEYDGSANDLASAYGTAIATAGAADDATVMCGNFYDTDGFVTDGLWTFDDGDNYVSPAVGTVESDLSSCAGI